MFPRDAAKYKRQSRRRIGRVSTDADKWVLGGLTRKYREP
jgi:hypothetical protein